jgi:hypothetical protein
MDNVKIKSVRYNSGSGGTSNVTMDVALMSVETAQRFIDDEIYREQVIAYIKANTPPNVHFVFVKRHRAPQVASSLMCWPGPVWEKHGTYRPETTTFHGTLPQFRDPKLKYPV